MSATVTLELVRTSRWYGAVIALNDGQRLEEVARMLGGVKITEQTRAHASEMIAANE